MSDRVQLSGLDVSKPLADLIARASEGTTIAPETFWESLAGVLARLAPKNRELLAERNALQAKIDSWHQERKGKPHDADAYKKFLQDIGYLVPEGPDFSIQTTGVDPEIASIAGPQLVVPVTIARYALNAANARWGSLYDALYGTDVIPQKPGTEKGLGYNPKRGAEVVAYAASFLDKAFALATGSHADASAYVVEGGKLSVKLKDGKSTSLAKPEQFAGYSGQAELTSVLLKNHGLHVEIQIDRTHPIGKDHAAGVKDVVLEAAMTTILDCEDSVACVDG